VLKHARALLDATDSSPLYIEDLLRLVHIGVPVTEAIGVWKKRRGDAARDYSIRREFEQLSEDAQQVLLAMALFDGPCTFEQLRTSLNWEIERIINAQQDLRQLYLLPDVRGTDAEAMSLNVNTRILVTRVFESSENYKRVRRAVNAVLGRLDPSRDERFQVKNVLQKCSNQITKAHRDDPALREVVRALNELDKQFPSRSDIHGALGWVYKKLGSRTDAREAYCRAVELGSKDGRVYWQWSDLEAEANEWSEAIRIAELGCKNFPTDAGLHQQLGYCLSRAGQEEFKHGDRARGLSMCKKAEAHLKKAVDILGANDRPSVRTKLFRSLVLNAHTLHDGEGVNRHLLAWYEHYPHDGNFEYEYDRLRAEYPEHIKRRHELPPLTGT
jgi:tetratricopeptide (TPR) repeat protein